jgi:deoxyhypusine synthase
MDKNSIVRSAYEEKIPIFSPALIDSMLGLQLYFFSQKNRIILNPLKDVDELVEMVFRARKTGGIFLGGGVPKHYILQVNLLRGGIDYGIQITLDREEAGSLSGAKLEEGISWGKAKAGSNLANVIGDATILFPLLIAGVKQRLNVK